jgi:hydrogenase maturation protein HypF
VEHGRTAPVLGLAFDGLGYGADGTFWGGELLVADFDGFERVGHLRPVPMPGGSAAIREPWRMAAVWAQLAGADPFEQFYSAGVDATRLDAVLQLAARGQAPLTSSMGRLFDAVAALLGCRTRVSYEAQAAIELEALARAVDRAAACSYDDTVIVTNDDEFVIDPAPLVARVIDERERGTPMPAIAAAFHETIGRAAADVAIAVARARNIDAVALTGGVFQNVRLTDVVEDELLRAGLRVLVHKLIPPNDGGISIGQAAIAAH